MSNRKIEKKKYYKIGIELDSPLSVGNGENVFSDSDVIQDGEGYYFVPGTSLAGAFRNYLGDKSNDSESIMGYEKPGNEDRSIKESGKMSQIFISDLYLDNTIDSIRDGIKLTDSKIAEKGKKFDMQIIETGATGTFHIEYVVRENEEDQSEKLNDIIFALQNGDIRLGSKKNRGFGRIKVVNIQEREFSKENLSEYIEFLGTKKEEREYFSSLSFAEWKKDKIVPASKYYTFKFPLKQNGGITIRRYSAKPEHPDYEHITCGPNNDPVIPGSSWNGAVRSSAKALLKMLIPQKNDIESIINQWFGMVKDKRGYQSNIVFGESVISGAEGMPVTRTSIDRFTGAVVSGALYTEYSYFGGTTELTFMIKKDAPEADALVGLMMLICKEIQKGYLPIGGQTAIGRGIFEANGEITDAEGNNITDFRKYNLALFELIEAVRRSSK